MELKELNNVKVDNEVTVKRGEVWYVHGEKFIGSEQMANRPAVVVSNDIGNAHSPVVEIVYITTSPFKAKLPTHVRVNNFKLTGVALCEQVTSIDKLRLKERVTMLNEQQMALIDKALCISLEITKKPEHVKASQPKTSQIVEQVTVQVEIPGQEENIIIKQANDRIKLLIEKGNLLNKTEQEITGIMQSDVVLTGLSSDYLSEEIKLDIKQKAAQAITAKKKELEEDLLKLIDGEPKRKAAVINQEFEKAVQEMESQSWCQTLVENCNDTSEEVFHEPSIEEKIYEVYVKQGLTIKQTAKELHLGQDKVCGILKEKGWTRKQGREAVFTVEEMKDLYIKQGKSVKDIAAQFECSTATVYSFLSANSIKRPSKRDK